MYSQVQGLKVRRFQAGVELAAPPHHASWTMHPLDRPARIKSDVAVMARHVVVSPPPPSPHTRVELLSENLQESSGTPGTARTGIVDGDGRARRSQSAATGRASRFVFPSRAKKIQDVGQAV